MKEGVPTIIVLSRSLLPLLLLLLPLLLPFAAPPQLRPKSASRMFYKTHESVSVSDRMSE
jgi:hypothetical protein